MAKPNYRLAKQQRERAKKSRQLEKQQRQASRAATTDSPDQGGSVPVDTETAKLGES